MEGRTEEGRNRQPKEEEASRQDGSVSARTGYSVLRHYCCTVCLMNHRILFKKLRLQLWPWLQQQEATMAVGCAYCYSRYCTCSWQEVQRMKNEDWWYYYVAIKFYLPCAMCHGRLLGLFVAGIVYRVMNELSNHECDDCALPLMFFELLCRRQN